MGKIIVNTHAFFHCKDSCEQLHKKKCGTRYVLTWCTLTTLTTYVRMLHSYIGLSLYPILWDNVMAITLKNNITYQTGRDRKCGLKGLNPITSCRIAVSAHNYVNICIASYSYWYGPQVLFNVY